MLCGFRTFHDMLIIMSEKDLHLFTYVRHILILLVHRTEMLPLLTQLEALLADISGVVYENNSSALDLF